MCGKDKLDLEIKRKREERREGGKVFKGLASND